MKKFLIVGCGGSGAKTQAYMIDQLKAYLRRVDPEIDRLPAAWQFVSIDSPLEAEKYDVPNVKQSGGSYISVGNRQHYNEFDTGLSRKLGQAGALGEIATWADRNPRTRNTPISDGAGQYRAIGRMLAINSFKEVRDGLEAAVQTLNKVETNSELNELNAKVTGQYQDATKETPLVFVISSMAGGTGASMAFDVCRLLSSIDGVQSGKTAVFMFTPEVFEAVNADKMTGTRGNALAMFGEAFAAQAGTAVEHDQRLLQAMGISGHSDTATFNRLFPIGARAGAQKSLFGDGSPGDIYRGLARSLAALMTSDAASNSFVQYDLGNTGVEAGDRSLLGWGSSDETKWELIPWGSMGFAELSMGRDRFAEYSAQRLSRTVFDHLLEGHFDKSDPATASEQLERRVHERQAQFFHECWLPSAPNSGAVQQWIPQLFGAPTRNVTQQAKGLLHSRIPAADGMKSAEWASLVRQRLAQSAGEVHHTIDRAASVAVFEFSNPFADNLLRTLEKDLSKYGLAYAEALIKNVNLLLKDGLINALRQLGQAANSHNPVAPTPQLEQLLAPLNGRGSVNNSVQISDQIIQSFEPLLQQHFWMCVAARLAPVLEDFRNNFLMPLSRQLENVHQDLEAKAKDKPTSTKLADVTTDEPTLWPSDGDELVADRFFESKNVKLITKVEEFPRDYEAHLTKTMSDTDGQQLNLQQATQAAIREIILGMWETTGGHKAPEDTLAAKLPERSDFIGNRAGWVARDLLDDPLGRVEKRDPRPGAFEVKLRPTDLLERSRQWLARPGEPFEQFISMGLRHYLSRELAPNDTVYNERLSRLRTAFYECLTLALPLASISKEMLGRVYGNSNEVYNFKFSEIPFNGLEAKDALLGTLTSSSSISQTSQGEFEKSLNTADHLQSFTVFGAYPNYSPIVFSSLFPAIGKQINSLRGQLDEFWTLRRARPLAAALPMSREERRTMIGGWFIGQITGKIYIRGANEPDGLAYIYSDKKNTWLPFVKHMLTPRTKFKADYDWLPAVLESIFVAYANVQEIPMGGQIGDSLQPYMLLRGLYDDGDQGPTTGGIAISGVRVLHEWLKDGQDRVHGQSPYGATKEERKQNAENYLKQWQQLSLNFIEKNPMGALPGSMPEGRPFARVTDRNVASSMPLFRDIAEDVYEMCDDLIRRLDEATQYQPTNGPGNAVPTQSFDSSPKVPTIPSFGGAPTMPGAAGTPETPVTPTQPSQPVQPAQPSQPTQPVQPSQPAEPSQPNQPNEPFGGSFDGPEASEPKYNWGGQDNSDSNPFGGPF